MTDTEFYEKLSLCTTPRELAVLADEILEPVDSKSSVKQLKRCVEKLLDKGLDAAVLLEEEYPWINSIAYTYNEDVLDIARMIFNKCGVPKEFYYFLRTKIDYNYYNEPYVVKLYLLASAYLWEKEETHIRMSQNLYEEMFVTDGYTSLQKDYKKLTLTPEIFKQIEKYDFSVEMTEQDCGKCSAWILHIFEKQSRIQVAKYGV